MDRGIGHLAGVLPKSKIVHLDISSQTDLTNFQTNHFDVSDTVNLISPNGIPPLIEALRKSQVTTLEIRGLVFTCSICSTNFCQQATELPMMERKFLLLHYHDFV